MPRTRAILVAAALLGACLPAFAPPVRVAGPHRDVSPAAADTSCLTCHPTQVEAATHGAMSGVVHGGAPIVATWMVNDRRGCIGCHDVRERRR